jgi:hypothetical protein
MIHRRHLPSQRRAWLARGALGLALGGSSGAAEAHGLEANHLQVVVHELTAEVVATPPSAFVADADANHDGRLDVAEVRARREEIIHALVTALVLTDGEGRAGVLDRADVSVPRGDDEGARGSDFLRLTVVIRWPAAPGAVRLRCGFVMEHPVLVYATHAESRSQPGVLTLVGDGEYATLATPHAEATLLRRAGVPAPAPTAPRTAATPSAGRPAPATRATTTAAVVLALATFAATRLRRSATRR